MSFSVLPAMALTESLVKTFASGSPKGYARRVHALAAIYFLLNLLSVGTVAVVAWRVKTLITLAQRSNVETLTLLIVLVLALNYILTTARGFTGALSIVLRNLPYLWGAPRGRVEAGKHRAMRDGSEPKLVCLDQVVAAEEDPAADLQWEVGDEIGKLGDVVIRGVELRYHPLKDGLNNSFFEYVVRQIEDKLKRKDPHARLEITFWGSIDPDAASAYRANVSAFRNLEDKLNQGPLWPMASLSTSDRAEIAGALRAIVPAIRDESFLPDVEYQARWTVPVLPEPLGLVQLQRSENRADPVAAMGCATIVMLAVLAALLLLVLLPPWVPSR